MSVIGVYTGNNRSCDDHFIMYDRDVLGWVISFLDKNSNSIKNEVVIKIPSDLIPHVIGDKIYYVDNDKALCYDSENQTTTEVLKKCTEKQTSIHYLKQIGKHHYLVSGKKVFDIDGNELLEMNGNNGTIIVAYNDDFCVLARHIKVEYNKSVCIREYIYEILVVSLPDFSVMIKLRGVKCNAGPYAYNIPININSVFDQLIGPPADYTDRFFKQSFKLYSNILMISAFGIHASFKLSKEKSKPKSECCICYEKLLQAVYLTNCKHFELCTKCYEKLENCPICREAVDKKVSVILSLFFCSAYAFATLG